MSRAGGQDSYDDGGHLSYTLSCSHLEELVLFGGQRECRGDVSGTGGLELTANEANSLRSIAQD